MEIPTIASNIPPYSLNIKHGTNGFLVNSPLEWEEYLENLILSKELRRGIGLEARSTVVKNYDISRNVYKYKEFVDDLFGKGIITV